MFRAIKNFFRDLIELMAPRLLFNCPECRDEGWVSYEDRIGTKTYHVFDHCRKCRPKPKPA